MSRFTAHTFHKPAPFEFPRAPLSPPDTNNETIGPSQVPTIISVVGPPNHHDMESSSNSLPPHIALTDLTSGSRMRRGPSSISYHNSGLKESREKTVQRGSKSFVIVIPPSSFAQERGQLGHTLSMGPSHRLNQGLLMPLFPTMYGQLTAIAREFNFPSTTGICLYLHFTENGVTMSPRISDEHWPFIWAQALDHSAPQQGLRPPVSGKIEFDIDFQQARWYGAWISSSHRDHADVPMSVNHSPAPSIVHFRAESRASMMDMLAGGDDQSDVHSQHPHQQLQQHHQYQRISAPFARHIPRKLSLVDRFDTSSVRSLGRPASRGLSPPEQHPNVLQVLSPIFQEDEPKTAKHALEHRVNSWRASAHVEPSALSANGQTSLEPANLPNTLALEDDDIPAADEPLNLADFHWSVSSLGPNDYEFRSNESRYTYSRLPSPDLAHRMFEDRPLTPATATSWGAPLSYPPSLVEDEYGNQFNQYGFEHRYLRALSPDMGFRAQHSRPSTPATATSWGPNSASWPPSPYAESMELSVHMDYRGVFSRPVTPATATSWGPSDGEDSVAYDDDAYSYSYSRALSIHLGDRGVFSRPVTPATATSWGPSDDEGDEEYYMHPSPRELLEAGLRRMPTPDVGVRSFEADDVEAAAERIRRRVEMGRSQLEGQQQEEQEEEQEGTEMKMKMKMGWPYFEPQSEEPAVQSQQQSASDLGQPWHQVWPYTAEAAKNEPWTHVWPYTESAAKKDGVWKHVWPYTTEQAQASRQPWTQVWPYYDASKGQPWHQVWPYTAEAARSGPWTHVWPYTAESSNNGPWKQVWPYTEEAAKNEPWTHVWPYTESAAKKGGVWKHVWPYTSEQAQTSRGPWSQVWPYTMHHALNDMKEIKIGARTKSVAGPNPSPVACYPSMVVYPPVYPCFDLYPDVQIAQREKRKLEVVYPRFDIYPAKLSSLSSPSSSTRLASVQVKLSLSYPAFNVYPSVYPFNLEEIYAPASISASVSASTNDPLLQLRTPAYPVIEIYKPAYPHLVIYPAVHALVEGGRGQRAWVRKAPGYPDFEIYPPVKPAKLSMVTTPATSVKPARPVKEPFKSGVVYPHFDIYPAVGGSKQTKSVVVYPNFDIYPAVDGPKRIKSVVVYPDFDIYPAVDGSIKAKRVRSVVDYPHFDIYPSVNGSKQIKQIKSVVIYPNFDIYPAIDGFKKAKRVESIVDYPHFDIYPAVGGSKLIRSVVNYPDFDLYPAVDSNKAKQVKSVVDYPLFDIYPMVNSPPKATTITHTGSASKAKRISRGGVWYPHFNIYPGVYPHLQIYPQVKGKAVAGEVARVQKKEYVRYPAFSLYPPVYPNFELYPAVQRKIKSMMESVTAGGTQYPTFVIYPDTYPRFNLYPNAAGNSIAFNRGVDVNIKQRYPFFSIYSAVFPNFNLYPAKPGSAANAKKMITNTPMPVAKPTAIRPFIKAPEPPATRSARYAELLTHSELHAMVMMEMVGSGGSFGGAGRSPSPFGSRGIDSFRSSNAFASLEQSRSSFDSPTLSMHSPHSTSTRPILSHRELHRMVFPNGIVSTPSGDSVEQARLSSSTPPPSSPPLSTSRTPSPQHSTGIQTQRRMTVSKPGPPLKTTLPPAPKVLLPASPRATLPPAPGPSPTSRLPPVPGPSPAAKLPQIPPTATSSRLSTAFETPEEEGSNSVPAVPKRVSPVGTPTPGRFQNTVGVGLRSGPGAPAIDRIRTTSVYSSLASSSDSSPAQTLSRSTSLALPRTSQRYGPNATDQGRERSVSSRFGPSTALERARALSTASQSPSNPSPPAARPAPPPRRDSTVLQRVRAFNSGAAAEESPLSMDSLNKFPTPPRSHVGASGASLPSGPRALDRSRYPFAS